MRWCDYSNTEHDPALYLAHVQSLGLVNYRTECRFLIKLYRLSGYPVTVFQEQHWLRHNSRPGPPSQLPLVTTAELLDAYARLESSEKLGFYLLASTGRRSCEINRLIFLPEQSREDQIMFRLPIQKNNVQNAIIILKTADSEISYPGAYAAITEYFSGPRRPFNWDRIRRRAGFRLHGLRNRFAIGLFLAGETEAVINERLGWTDCRSLRRYVRVSFDYLRRQNDVDSVVRMIRSLS